MNYRKKALLSDQISTFNFLVGQSHDVWRSYSFFAARVASFASDRECANDATTRDTNKLYATKVM